MEIWRGNGNIYIYKEKGEGEEEGCSGFERGGSSARVVVVYGFLMRYDFSPLPGAIAILHHLSIYL